MADPIKKEDDISIRTMKDDLEKPAGNAPKAEVKPAPIKTESLKPIAPPPSPPAPSQPKPEPKPFTIPPAPAVPAPQAPAPTAPPIQIPAPAPAPVQPPKLFFAPPLPPVKPPTVTTPSLPKTIPPKEIPSAPIKPLFKTTPVWIKLGMIGFGIIAIILAGLYGYWKIFVQGNPAAVPPAATSTVPTLPINPPSSSAPAKFFNKLPNKTVTIDLPAKTSAALTQALKSEAKISEILSSVKQIKITYQGKLLVTKEFLELMTVFTPNEFLSNYEDDFAFAFYSQKEGARPILMLKAKSRAASQTQLENWEKSTLASDVLPLFLTDFKLPNYLPSFKSYLFIGQPVRFLNINLPFASLNYSIYGDYLIFTTSSGGMFIILQDLTGQNVSRDYSKSIESSINQFFK